MRAVHAVACSVAIAALASNAIAFTQPQCGAIHRVLIQAYATAVDEEQQQQQPKSSTGTPATTMREKVANSGIASAAAMATAAVNAAVAMKSLEAPDVGKTYVAIDKSTQELDEDGLPMVYDKDLIERYWSTQKGQLNQRWTLFVSKAVPFLTKLTTLFIRDGKIEDSEIPALSRQARLAMEDLGPTFIKLGQMVSTRPDVLPTATLDELSQLQDSVLPFDTNVAVEQIERELDGPLGQFFTSISEEPVAAASLAQVYLATLNDGSDTKVAVKVQRPSVLETVSKDLYVLRRAAEVVQGLVNRFAPQQKTNYVALLNEWAIGFYTELDFNNEAKNQIRLRNLLREKGVRGVVVPDVYEEYCTRRILVSQWVDGKKLSQAPVDEIARVTPIAQEAFLTQLFEGYFHADPHPGNLLLLDEVTPEGHELALIDCGLMANIDASDRDNMISTVIHLANKDYASLVDDFIQLNILPADCNRAAIIPLMDKALSPYVKGGGAKKYEEELKRLYGMEDGSTQATIGGFQAMTQDALTVLNDIPFSIPPYLAILGRAIVTLEGIALTGRPDYGIVMESYPFIARKLMREDRPEIQSALQEVLYTSGGGSAKQGLKLSRLLALLNNAAGQVATKEGAAFVDLDAVPEDGISFKDGLKFLLSDSAESLRAVLEPEVDGIVDILTRQIVRQGVSEAIIAITPPKPPTLPFVGDFLPNPPNAETIPLPILLPGARDGERPSIAVLTVRELCDVVAPKLSQDEELFALSLSDAAREFFGDDVGEFVRGENVLSLRTAEIVLAGLRSGVIGNIDLFSSDVRARVIEVAGGALSSVRSSQQQQRQSNNSPSVEYQEQLQDAIGSLDDDERKQFDTIVDEITDRALQKVAKRLELVNRVL